MTLSVKENLELICGIHGFTKEKTDTRIRELSAKFKLDAVLTKRAGTLSGSWKRRVSIAMALISEPEILFLDEPTLGLDVIARYDLWALILELKGKVMSFNKQELFHPISQSNLKMPPLCLPDNHREGAFIILIVSSLAFQSFASAGRRFHR